MHPGGIADKTGNRFEAWWLINQIVDLLDGTATAITIEKIGEGEEGFEFSVERAKQVEWHQCKRQTSENSWTINALSNEGILVNFLNKLNQSAMNRCIFVSTDLAKQIKLLKEKRPLVADVASFEKLLSVKETAFWRMLQEQLNSADDAAFDWLERSSFITIPEDTLATIVEARICYWFTNDPDTVIGRLRTWIEEDENFNVPINYRSLFEFISSTDLQLKQYQADRTLPGRITSSTEGYIGSYRPIGAGLFNIPRREAEQLFDALTADNGVKTVALAGTAGSGKSAIVRAAIERLAAEHILHLAFRADQVGEPLSLSQLGTAVIDVPDSPAVVLEQLSGDRRAVLFIDQADAVSEMSGRSAQLRRQLISLVNQAARYTNIRVVFSCRTFDIDNDHIFAEIAARPQTLRIDVSTLDWEKEVFPILLKLGISVNGINSRIKTLLCQPIGLALAAELSQSGVTDLRNVENLSQLFHLLLHTKENAIRRDHKPGWSLFTVLEEIAEEMSRRQELFASSRLFDKYPGSREILQREGLVVVSGRKISLMHESLFDYLHARVFVDRGEDLLSFIQASEQTLFRRTQVRQILSTEREIDYKRYLLDLDVMLNSENIRPHVRDVILRWISTVSQPTSEEWKVLTDYASKMGDTEYPRSISMTIFDRTSWFDLLMSIGAVEKWLSGSQEARQWALRYLRSVSDQASTAVAALLHRFLDSHPQCATSLFDCFRWASQKHPASELADVIIRTLSMTNDAGLGGSTEGPFEIFANWTEGAAVDATRIFEAILRAWYRLNPEGTPFNDILEGGAASIHYVAELAKAAPLETLGAILPAMAEAMRRTAGDGDVPAQDRTWFWRPHKSTDIDIIDCLDIVRGALATIATSAPNAVKSLFEILEPDRQITALHLLLETVAHNGQALADLIVEHRDNPALFEAGWEGAPAYSATKALAAAWPHFSAPQRDHFEARIRSLFPEFRDAKRCLELSRNPGERTALSSDQLKESARHYLRTSGRQQWSVLRALDVSALSPEARERLRILGRKFEQLGAEIPRGLRGGMVESPIPSDRTAQMSDAAWVSAMKKISSRADRVGLGEGLRGGPAELAHVLQQRTKEFPERFMGLLERLPQGISTEFADGIARGISEATPTPDIVERVFEAAERNPSAQPSDRALMGLIRATAAENGARATAFISQAALHSHDGSDIGGHAEDASEMKEVAHKRAINLGSRLSSRSMNSIRGVAIEKMGHEGWLSKSRFEIYCHILNPIVGTKLPDFIHSSLGIMILAALKHQPSIALDWITRTASVCPIALFTRQGRQALRWLDYAAPLDAEPILTALIGSDDPLSRAIGCLIVAQRSLDDSRWAATVDTLIERGADERAAIAQAAVSSIGSAKHRERSAELLIRFFEDDDERVRLVAVDCFRRFDTSQIKDHLHIYMAYVGSKYFNGERTYFLHRLSMMPSDMDEFALELIERTVAAIRAHRSDRTYSLYQVWDPLLRIYASCGDNANRLRRCLDVIDQVVVLDAVGSEKLNAAT